MARVERRAQGGSRQGEPRPTTSRPWLTSVAGGLARLSGTTGPGLPQSDPRFLARKIRVAVTPRGRLLKARLANGAVVYGHNRPGFGGRGVYIFGDAVEPEFEHLDKFLSSSGVFVDIGANTGKYAIKAAQHYRGRGVVLAIEPFTGVLATLERSVRANRFRNVRLRNICMGECTEALPFFMNGQKPHDFSLIRFDDAAFSYSVLTVALDDLFAWERLDRLDYLKLDAMGSEEEVLRGGKSTIAKYRPIIQLQASVNADVAVALDEYSAYRAPESPVKFYIPDEHDKRHVPEQLGWRALG
jgi:FkbM family methyltransferase